MDKSHKGDCLIFSSPLSLMLKGGKGPTNNATH